MDVKFPFEDEGGNIFRPVAKVTLQSPFTDKIVDVWMVVDTGADYTILPRHYSTKLRVSLEKNCQKNTTFGVGGEQTVYFLKKKIKAKIGHLQREIPLAFIDSNEIPALLGRLGFLETFDTEFLRSRCVVFKN